MNAYQCTIPAELIPATGQQSRTYIAWTLLQAVDMHLALILNHQSETDVTRCSFKVRGPHATLNQVNANIEHDRDTRLTTLTLYIEELI